MFKIVLSIFLCAAVFLPAQETLDRYIDQALDSNLALKQADFSYEKSLASLREARGMFLPAVNINARYSRAQGGRTIEFPIGDMLNPIYSTLNLLTGAPLFPTDIPNQEFQFFREREHDTQVRVIQPLFQPKIYHNYKIQKYLREIEGASRRAYARQLVAEVKTAYYNFLTAIQVVELADRTQTLLQENLRVSQLIAYKLVVSVGGIRSVKRGEVDGGAFQAWQHRAVAVVVLRGGVTQVGGDAD